MPMLAALTARNTAIGFELKNGVDVAVATNSFRSVRGRPVVWPTQRVQSQVLAEQRQLAFTEVPDTIALICWLHKEPLLAALSALVDAESDDAASLSHEARQQREAEAMGDLIDTKGRRRSLFSRTERRLAVRTPQRHQTGRAAWSAVDHGTAQRNARNDAGTFVAVAAMTPIVQPRRLACQLPGLHGRGMGDLPAPNNTNRAAGHSAARWRVRAGGLAGAGIPARLSRRSKGCPNPPLMPRWPIALI